MNDGMPNPDVWAIGDAANIEDAPLPATAQGQCYPMIIGATFLAQTYALTSCKSKGQIPCQEIE
jgi:hypothetical protein